MKREEIEALAEKYIDECDGTDDDGLGCFSGVHVEMHLADWLWNAYTAGLERAAEIAESVPRRKGYTSARIIGAIGYAAAAIRSEKHQD